MTRRLIDRHVIAEDRERERDILLRPARPSGGPFPLLRRERDAGQEADDISGGMAPGDASPDYGGRLLYGMDRDRDV